MRKIKMSGSGFRSALFMDDGLKQRDCATYTGINSRIVSELLRGRQTFDAKNLKDRSLIYGFYKEKVRLPISLDDFWCISKILEEVK